MNTLDESAPGETDREKSVKSRVYIESLIHVYEEGRSRTPARVDELLIGVVPHAYTLPYPYLFHISNLDIEDTSVVIEQLIKIGTLSHTLQLIYENLISHQNGEEIIKKPILVLAPKNK